MVDIALKLSEREKWASEGIYEIDFRGLNNSIFDSAHYLIRMKKDTDALGIYKWQI